MIVCYVCDAQFDARVRDQIANEIDRLSFDDHDMFVRICDNELSLVHCVGDESMFDDNGRVNVCANCFHRACMNVVNDYTIFAR